MASLGGRVEGPPMTTKIGTTVDAIGLMVIHSLTGNTLLDVTLVIYNFDDDEGKTSKTMTIVKRSSP